MRKWLLIGGGALVGLLVIAGAALALFFPKEAVRAEIERQVERATERDVTIGAVNVAFWPALGVAAERVSLSNPRGFAAGGPFLSADRVVFAVAVLPLFRGDIQVKRLILERPALALAVNAQGAENWAFPTPADRGKQQSVQALSIDELRIRNGRFSFAGKDGEPLGVDDIDAAVKMRSLDTPAEIESAFDYRGRRVRVEGRLGRPRALLENAQTPLTARISAPRVAARFDGAWDAETGALIGRLEASGESLRDALSWMGSPLPAGGGFAGYSVRAQMAARGAHDDAPTTIALTQGAFGLDAVRAQGGVTLAFSEQGRMRASGRLTIPELNLNPYMGPAAAAAAGATSAQAAQAAQAGGGLNAQTAWSAAPLDLNGLKAADVDLNLSLNRLRFQRMTFSNAQLALRIENGVADARLARVALYGGAGTARLVANAQGNRIRSEIDFQNIQAEPLLRDAIGFDRIAGRGRLRATLEGGGASQAALMRSLGGTASFVFNDGQWKGVNLAQVARTIQTLGRAGSTGGSSTDFAELSASFRVVNGAAVTQDLKLLNPFVRLDGQGIIDIGRQSIDMRIAPRAVSSMQGQGGRADVAGIGVPFRINGPWSRVQFTLAVGDLVQRELQQRMGGALSGDTPLGALGAAITGRQPAQDAQKDKEKQSEPRLPDLGSLFKRN